jgi:chromate transport protein ChrA
MTGGGATERTGAALVVLPVVFVGACLAGAYGTLLGGLNLVLGGALVALIALLAMYVPLKRMMVASLAGADFSAVGFRIKRLDAVASYAPKGVTMLLAIPVAVTTSWFYVWWLAPLAALAIVIAVMLLGWFSYRSAVLHEPEHHAKRKIDHHVKEQKARMRARYRNK